MSRLDRFLAEHGLTLLRLEHLSGVRNRIVVEHDRRILAVSYSARRPTRVALRKLDHYLQAPKS